ncbi:uncharacterized protein LOC585121 [Strongylocentrotus purpuratus]|uniref:Uncharacterized protein n=1 Tax=Strongylocentrotus purpuratus TaxID=7668 RepID=A0A7M7P4H1_STRPU|nr:uncharacterized protein LOC115925492 [Strongylocentrotus purpuratus]XP_800321.1 uncharacterized protein LOC585121 [Strongylocentrotus purpuratus]|eukprot:XP_800321.1 PREDICTED: uncharacterized protein LOC585121 [Strongylocentrotus purpuratus]
MASTFGFITILGACLLVTVTALNCYTCNNCAKTATNLQQTSRLCPAGVMGMAIPQCYHEMTSMGTLNRGCTNRSDCTSRSTQRMERQCGPGVQPPCFACCETDNCNVGNGAAMTTVSMATFLLLLVPSILSMFVSW